MLKIAQHYKAKIYTAEYNPDRPFDDFSELDVEVIGRQGLLKGAALRQGVAGAQLRASFYS